MDIPEEKLDMNPGLECNIHYTEVAIARINKRRKEYMEETEEQLERLHHALNNLRIELILRGGYD